MALIQTQKIPNRTSWVFALTIFLSAFLLFQVQLVLSKYILPWFGGSAAVWTTNMLVFQTLLLAGYIYSHFVSERLLVRKQAALHIGLLSIAFLVVVGLFLKWPSPITPPLGWRPASELHPVRDIILITLLASGLPFFILSTTGPLLQRWYVERGGNMGTYRLYSVSNLGSLVGLLSFPFVLEPLLHLRVLGTLWGVLFLIFCGGCAWSAWLLPSPATGEHQETSKMLAYHSDNPPLPYLLWFLLAACASAQLLATTNQLCQEIISVPLLWVLPLALYLLSFILCFDHPRWYRRAVFHPSFIVGVFALIAAMTYGQFTAQLLLMPLVLFIGCMICHGELARLKPAEKQLTVFYLMVAAGGAFGSLCVAIVSPQIFRFFTEFQISLGTCCVLLLVCLLRDEHSWIYSRGKLLPIIGCMMVGLVGIGLYKTAETGPELILAERNFYGALRVITLGKGSKVLYHTHTIHGAQMQAPYDRLPTLYYGPNSGIGILLRNHPKRIYGAGGLRVGIVGLGAGTLAAYGQRHDYFRYYEINPQVVNLSIGSTPIFTYLRDSNARVETKLGDARLLLEQELAQGDSQVFDLLVLDAFSGDAVPVHLLTREAFDIYFKHLRDHDGIIALHLSTRYIDLLPVVEGFREYSHCYSLVKYTEGRDPFLPSLWVFLAKEPEALHVPELVPHPPPIHQVKSQLWTDDYSNILRLFY